MALIMKGKISGRCSRISAADKIRAAEKVKKKKDTKPAVQKKVIPHGG